MAQSEIRIGEVAERAGVSIDTVRYYERRRLLPRAPRTQGGFRVFTGDAVERVRFIPAGSEPSDHSTRVLTCRPPSVALTKTAC